MPLKRPEWNLLVSDAPFGGLFLDNRDTHPAAIGPVTLTRLDGPQTTHQLWGVPGDGGAPNVSFQTTSSPTAATPPACAGQRRHTCG